MPIEDDGGGVGKKAQLISPCHSDRKTNQDETSRRVLLATVLVAAQRRS